MGAALRLCGLGKRFGGRVVLQNLELDQQSGTLLSVLGASGSGKTTLLRLICGFEQPDYGSIEIDGRIVFRAGAMVPPEQRRIGYVAQDAALFPHLKVAENISFGLPRAQRRARYRVDQLLELVGLGSAYADRAPHALSGGEQQRVALARALAPEPALVLLDEPFSALDAGLRQQTRLAVAQALGASRTTALLVTHDQAEALSMGDQVAVLRDGNWAQIDRPEVVYRTPADLALAAFVGEAVVLPCMVAGGQAECALGRLKLLIPHADGVAQVMVRPEQIRIGPPGRYHKVGSLVSRSFMGAETRVVVRMETGEKVIARQHSDQLPENGEKLAVRVEGKVMAYPTSP